MFRGLFVGIDRYASPKVNWLSCASRDATALCAIFEDTLGGEALLLTDEAATRVAIAAELKKLAQCDGDDFVVITFSGHGSETHELVTHDSDPRALAESGIPLETLTEWFAAIPAKRLVCILDCCFSGGMGAKVLHVDSRPKSLGSTDEALDLLSGEGRLVLTASRATEPAWENVRVGHGLLTHFLLEALQGAEEVRQGNKVSVYRLLEYVTKRVIDGARALGKQQNPTLRGRIDGEFMWPRFQPGAVYRGAFPDQAKAPVGADLRSLSTYGFPEALIAAWASSIPSLNQLQQDAINEYRLLDGEHLVVSAPTSSGKTMIGELSALTGALERRRALFLLPLKALVNDKYAEFRRRYGAFGIRTIRATGEMIDDIPQLMRGQYDICLLTYEKFAVLVLTSPHILDAVGTVVVDEVQMMADRSRGTNLEFLLTLLRMRGQDGIGPQLVALSAVIGETNGFERWLGARLLRRTERPVPLDEGVLRGDGSYRYVDSSGQEIILDNLMQREWRKDSSQDWVIPLVRKLVGEGKQVIVFRETRGETRGCALYLARELNLPPARAVIDALPTGDPSDSSSALREALAGGVAFHNSNLDRDERLLVEEHFRKPGTSLRVIAATTTLAMGVNTPAEAVVIVGLEHPGPEPYSVAEYKNMVGRAGRLGFSDRGVSYLLAVTPQEEHYTWNRYVRGVPEDIESRFLSRDTDPRSLIVRVLAATQQVSVQGLTSDEIVGFLEGSFGAYQERQRAAHWKWDQHQLRDALDDLEAHRLVIREDGLHYRLTELGRLAGEGGVQVESITRLVEALGSADASEINDPTLITAGQLTVELDDVLFPLNKKSTQKEPQTWRQELHRQGVAPSVMRALNRNVRDQHGPTLRAKKAAACLLSVTDLPMAEIERALTRFGGAPDGAAGPVRAVATRTCDLLPTVVRVAELLHAELNLEERARRLLIRLEVGVSAAAVDLASHIGTRFTRGDYRALLNIGHGSIAVVEVASDEILLSCLGGDREKLAEVRRAVRLHREQEREANAGPVLPVYEG